MANRRVYYAVQAAAVSECGENDFTAIHGLQSIGVNTQFNLEQVFEMGQIAIYENIETIPDVEITTEKVLDGYPPVYLLATKGAASASLTGRSNIKATVGLSIYSDVQDSASGTPLSQCTMSGVYVSSVSYTMAADGNFSESLSLVGNNRVWDNAFTSPAFNNDDSPLSITGSGGVNRREDFLLGEASANVSKLPTDIPGVTASGTVPFNTTTQEFGASLQSVRVSTNLGREQLFELGRRGPFHRYVSFPVEVTTEIEVLAREDGDGVTALEDAESNVDDQEIIIRCREGLVINCGTRNKLASANYGGANAAQNGGNATMTYSYTNFNDMTVQHPMDPTNALRP